MQPLLKNSVRSALLMATLLICSFGLNGCGESKGPPDVSMTTSVAGLWVGKTNPDVSLDIQDGGSIKVTRAGKESLGTWKQNGAGAIKATVDGKDFDMPYTRRDLKLTITAPGDTTPSDFEQM